MITGDQLREARVQRGLGRQELADLIGVSLRTVGTWERSQVSEANEAEVWAKLFAVDRPLANVSNLALVQELLQRFSTAAQREQGRWLVAYGPDAPDDVYLDDEADLALATQVLNRLQADPNSRREQGRWIVSYGPPDAGDDDDAPGRLEPPGDHRGG